MITGGEPLLFTDSLIGVVLSIQSIAELMNKNPKIFVYTSICNYEDVLTILAYIDGIVLTPHKKSDIKDFIYEPIGAMIELPKGSIKKLIERKLTWDDEPVEI